MNWSCPHCQRDQVLTSNIKEEYVGLHAGAKDGDSSLAIVSVVCANAACKQLALQLVRYRCTLNWGPEHGANKDQPLNVWQLLPASNAKPQPNFIPQVLRDDYSEACAIRDLSPKASATLSRRCLQGMIRDFCKISKPTLAKEIDELEKIVKAGNAPAGVQLDTVGAIDAIRKVGNIGAHMESDINVIVEIDAGEAQTLIGLIEMLFEEWYVAREKRAAKIKDVIGLAQTKQAAKAAPAAASPPAGKAKP